MKFKIIYSVQAKRDLRDIHTYIEYGLLEPETAKNVSRKITQRIRSLDKMPMRFRLYDEEPLRSRGLRVLPVDKYLVFYIPDEDEMTVEIAAIIYGGRDIGKQLEEIDF
ncbi:MAG: type II toxin-antitoxin system RelE/ParE family toxin [Oscillospiraceae bacterium]|nr:type II toxin-antitoxin system RelE/ParE family toxin [Oscillospiraceae bacterium]